MAAVQDEPAHDELERLRHELGKTVEIPDRLQEMLEVAAIVEEALAPADIHLVVVGGLAVAYWVAGSYLTTDIDVVMPSSQRVDERMERLGFIRDGRFWKLPGRDVFFEAPGSTLEPSPGHFEVVEVASGRQVRVQAPADVLIVRLQEFVAAPKTDVFQQCLLLLRSPALDRATLEQQIEEAGLTKALNALDAYAETIERGGRFPEPWELKDLARRL